MSKGLPELLEEKRKSEGHEIDAKKFDNVPKGLVHKSKSKASVHLNQDRQRNRKDDPPGLKGEATDSVVDLSSTTVKNIMFLGAILACRDNAPQIIQSLGLSEIKSDILKRIVDRLRTKDHNINDSAFYKTANSGTVQANRNATYANGYRRYDDDLTGVQAMIKKVLNNTNVSRNLIDKRGDLVQVRHTSKENDQQNDFLYEHFLVTTGGEGGGDPEQTKLIHSIPLGKSGIPATLARYLIELKAREIHAEVLQKERDIVDSFKTTKSSLDKLSWREKCEENSVDIPTSDEEADDGLLALADLLYCRGETEDNMLDIIFGLDDDNVHQFADTQTVDDEEGQNDDKDEDDDDDDSVANDSDNKAPDNGGSEGTDIPPLQAAYKTITIEVESSSYSGNHELAGTDRTIPTTDYWARQSQLAGTQTHQSTKLGVHEIKHHLLITNGSSISMTTEGVFITNETVDVTHQNPFVPMPQGPSGYNHQLHGGNGLNNEEENDAVEQAPEVPLLYPQLEQTLSPTITTTQDLLLQFPQAEDQPAPLSNEVESPVEDLPEDQYVDAVEAQPEDPEENEDCQSSSFVSASAENVDDEAEMVHYAKRRRWLDCCLL